MCDKGVTFPAMMAMWACWAPPLERARLMTISGAGGNFGAFIAFPLTGFICHSLGWPAVFYWCGNYPTLISLLYNYIHNWFYNIKNIYCYCYFSYYCLIPNNVCSILSLACHAFTVRNTFNLY